MAETKRFATYPSLRDRVVVISGGATGIGGSMTEEFALQHSKVIILDIQENAAKALTERLSKRGVTHEPIFHYCDVTDIDGHLIPVATKILKDYPRVDAVINNAANDVRQKTLDLTTEDWDKGIAINLRHTFFLTQALIPGLVTAGSSSVILMGSITWNLPGEGMIPYVASKSAMVGLTKRLAHEFGRQGVRVNSIMPGAIATERQKRDIITPEYEAQILEKQALKRILEPDDVARLALWLAADDGSGVTSQSLVVDGGWI